MSTENEVPSQILTNVRAKLKQLQEQQERIEPYVITLVTPMFGGSSEQGKINLNFPIRSSSIRGHLRFWWRATRGAMYDNVRDLRKHEVAIFGDTDTPSRVKLWVTADKAKVEDAKETILNKDQKKVIKFKKGFPKYALFPYEEQGQLFYIKPTYKFRLYIRYEDEPAIRLSNSSPPFTTEIELDLRKEIEAALWAWINFGGLGSRSRRGCGSMHCDGISPGMNEVRNFKKWFAEKIRQYELSLLPAGQYREWPTLSRDRHIVQGIKPAWDARPQNVWGEVIQTYQTFRQSRNIKEDEKIGRSHWPEADSLRRITGMAEPDHHDSTTLPDKTKEELPYAFPRAQLGLPILFNFTQSKNLKASFHDKREPYKTELLPAKAGKTRLASPLILKALAIEPHKSVGAIIVLNHKPVEGLKLTVKEDKEYKPKKNTREEEHFKQVESNVSEINIGPESIYSHLDYPDSPMSITRNETATSVISAIEAFLESEGVKQWQRNQRNNSHQKKPSQPLKPGQRAWNNHRSK
ncbi:type III-B CRISPR module RAMP protein Cmr1 [Paenibacillus sp. GCM10012307]|uniref:Type III-B CRISPR module RAMP protein Cmr1 n=1 Tax=Paenibacillus roseus TaxID=2798579 RepID=A0A934MX86_9BACL|nr:type III-B CRISPR module RAMP protein Cmr1 [Paenibacillus roseus]MBJ6363927.1 type III-B CRISPR module RAMP protein Cmr1 [Paenibacillus roseus]